MSYVAISDPLFLGTVESWFRERAELLALIRYSHAAGSKEFQSFSSFAEFKEKVLGLPHMTCVIVFRQPQLPLRGIVDDAFIDRCIQSIPDRAEYVVTKTARGQYGFEHRAGETNTEMRADLEDFRGALVAVGLYPPWEYDNEDVISGVVPDEHGAVSAGCY